MLPAQIVFLAASRAVLGMATDSGLWAAATLQPGAAILAGIQARTISLCLWCFDRPVLIFCGALLGG